MTDTAQAETATQEEVKNNVATPSAPQTQPTQVAQQVNTADGEVEKLRRELEQAQMRANQLNNQLEAKARAEEEARSKQLEEQNEFKSLYEQEKAKREAIESERLEAETRQNLTLAQDTIFAEFDPAAIEVAKEAGLTLTDDSDEAKENFKTRLQKIADKVVSTNKVASNNPAQTAVDAPERAVLVQQMRAGNKEARDKVVGTLGVLDTMRKQAGYSN